VKYISITLGLYYDFISAWRSGSKPSPSKETKSSKQLIKVKGLSAPPYESLKILNKIMPIVTTIPIHILLLPSFSSLSFTLEQKIPTKITESRLQDLTITTAGKEAVMTALLYVHILRLITALHASDFLAGISIR